MSDFPETERAAKAQALAAGDYVRETGFKYFGIGTPDRWEKHPLPRQVQKHKNLLFACKSYYYGSANVNIPCHWKIQLRQWYITT